MGLEKERPTDCGDSCGRFHIAGDIRAVFVCEALYQAEAAACARKQERVSTVGLAG